MAASETMSEWLLISYAIIGRNRRVMFLKTVVLKVERSHLKVFCEIGVHKIVERHNQLNTCLSYS